MPDTPQHVRRRRVRMADDLEWRLRRLGGSWESVRVAYAYHPDELDGTLEWEEPGYYMREAGKPWAFIGHFYPKADARVWSIVHEEKRPLRAEKAREGFGVFLQIVGAIAPFVIDLVGKAKK